MAKEEKIKVSFSISLTKSYSAQDIVDWEEMSKIDGYDTKEALYQMIFEDVVEAMRNGKGCFRIIG